MKIKKTFGEQMHGAGVYLQVTIELEGLEFHGRAAFTYLEATESKLEREAFTSRIWARAAMLAVAAVEDHLRLEISRDRTIAQCVNYDT